MLLALDLGMHCGWALFTAAGRRLASGTWASASQAADGMDILATSFADTDDKAAQMMAAMPGLLDVAKAGRESIATSAEITTATMSQFGLSADQTGRIETMAMITAPILWLINAAPCCVMLSRRRPSDFASISVAFCQLPKPRRFDGANSPECGD